MLLYKRIRDMFIHSKVDVKRMFLIVIISLFSAISFHFALIIWNIYVPLSHTLNNPAYISAILYEFVPIALMISVLFLFRLNKIKIEKEKNYDVIGLIVIVVTVAFSVVILLREIDTTLMVMFPTGMFLHGTERRFVSISFHILFYSLLSVVLMVVVALFFKRRGLKTFLPIYIIPAFYTLNADLIMRAGEYAAFSLFYPIYQLILEFGKLETIFVVSLLNLLNVPASFSIETFPFKLMLQNNLYLIDLPCIGWEGIMGYSIIFVNFILDIEKNNKMRLVWSVLGFLGTIFVNTVRLTIIFVMGAVYGAETAMYIHQHLGDVIFVVWIFLLVLIIGKIRQVGLVHSSIEERG